MQDDQFAHRKFSSCESNQITMDWRARGVYEFLSDVINGDVTGRDCKDALSPEDALND